MSEWIGKVGEHISIEVAVKGYVHRPAWDKNLILFEDKNKNIISIISAGTFNVGNSWVLDGTIKRHNMFNGQRQTHIVSWGLLYRPNKK